MRCDLVSVHQVDQFWPSLSQGFQRAVMKTGGDITVGELWQGARSGQTFLLVAHDETEIRGASIWVPQVWQTGGKLRCLALWGRGMKDWIEDMHELATRVMRDCGATSLVSEGRTGWPKIFPQAKNLRNLYEETP